LVRVDLRRGSGIVHRLGRGGAPLQRVEWPEGQP
ncbi:hypothetical protein K3Z99_15750, partial [Pseudomonas aeruginosa]|nr:hypothetical protein [Pseudomonas aeruginosa]